jgi:hypothetical protein
MRRKRNVERHKDEQKFLGIDGRGEEADDRGL